MSQERVWAWASWGSLWPSFLFDHDLSPYIEPSGRRRDRYPTGVAPPRGRFGVIRVPTMRISRRLEDIDPQSSGWWTRIAADLRVTSLSADRLVAQMLLAVGASLLIPPVVWAVLASSGIQILPFAVVLTSMILVVLSVLLPVLSLRREAERRQKGVRAVLGSFIDLVVLCLAGGMGVEGALYAAAGVGGDWVSRRFTRAFAFCTDSGRPLWDGLDQLGDELRVQELNELAATLRLAGTEGARVRRVADGEVGISSQA